MNSKWKIGFGFIEWEKARLKGALRLNPNGNIIEADLATQAEENGLELDWIRHNMDSIRLDHGFSIKTQNFLVTS